MSIKLIFVHVLFQVRSLVAWLYYLSDGDRKTPVLRQVLFLSSLSIDQENLHRFSYEYDIYNAVVNARYTFPNDFPPVMSDLVEKLLVK